MDEWKHFYYAINPGTPFSKSNEKKFQALKHQHIFIKIMNVLPTPLAHYVVLNVYPYFFFFFFPELQTLLILLNLIELHCFVFLMKHLFCCKNTTNKVMSLNNVHV